ncbi:glycosyltransferase [Pseudomonas coleopterorum]|uniref:glycosyltransferase n=1 Tax=Pseudomonas coleopterorum TaxID=1605838 RepID=UPI0017840D92|nr:glycosyltransferase [Pseudomonas coleopterorum]MBD8483853.1 glycosyltransferase [Pseudomonas coleopterorum]
MSELLSPFTPNFDTVGAFAAGFALITAILVLVTMLGAYQARWADKGEKWQILAVVSLSACMALPFAPTMEIISVAAITLLIYAGVRWLAPKFSVAGVCFSLGTPLILGAGGVWYWQWLSGLGLSGWHFTLFVALPLMNAAEALLDYLLYIGTYSLLVRKIWHEPTSPFSLGASDYEPFVSIHVPCHAEPPELVVGTLNALAQLDYKNYEVIVCDNNTVDVSLWRPLEIHCAKLNVESGVNRFRFLHVDGIMGAKAGALNYCLDRTNPLSVLIAVVDADYIAQPDFLRALTPHFEDPDVDFVQTSHDYHDHSKSLYNKFCYWEYMLGTKFSMAGLNELHAAFTIGTMCVLRRAAVEEAGRWALWCLTEDSEIAIRLRANGGKGRYFRDSFGRGTIPDTFEDLKQQRFRWTAGPVQQLMVHWRLFLPNCLGGSPHLSNWSKLFESVRNIQIIFGMMTLLVSIIVAMGMLILLEDAIADTSAPLPPVAIFIAFGLSFSAFLMTAAGYWLAGCRSFRIMLGSMLASAALTHTRMIATAAALLRLRLSWKRTPKFTKHFGVVRALYATSPEILLGGFMIVLLVALVARVEDIGWIAVLIAGTGLLRFAFTLLAAPIVCLLSINLPPSTKVQSSR